MTTPLELMAEHQHYISENPQTFHYHFRGRGEAAQVAQWAMHVVRATGAPLPQPKSSNSTIPLPMQKMARIIGGKAMATTDGCAPSCATRFMCFILRYPGNWYS